MKNYRAESGWDFARAIGVRHDDDVQFQNFCYIIDLDTKFKQFFIHLNLL